MPQLFGLPGSFLRMQVFGSPRRFGFSGERSKIRVGRFLLFLGAQRFRQNCLSSAVFCVAPIALSSRARWQIPYLSCAGWKSAAQPPSVIKRTFFPRRFFQILKFFIRLTRVGLTPSRLPRPPEVYATRMLFEPEILSVTSAPGRL